MKNKIKGLLALVLSVLIGQVWAATPVATWTNMSTATSGDYTLNGNGNTIADGVLTIGSMPSYISGTAWNPRESGKALVLAMRVTNLDLTKVSALVSLKMTNNEGVSTNNQLGLMTDGEGGMDAMWTSNIRGGYNSVSTKLSTTATEYLIVFKYDNSGTYAWAIGNDGVFANYTKDTSCKGTGTVGDDIRIGALYGDGSPATGLHIHSMTLWNTNEGIEDIIAACATEEMKMNRAFVENGTGAQYTATVAENVNLSEIVWTKVADDTTVTTANLPNGAKLKIDASNNPVITNDAVFANKLIYTENPLTVTAAITPNQNDYNAIIPGIVSNPSYEIFPAGLFVGPGTVTYTATLNALVGYELVFAGNRATLKTVDSATLGIPSFGVNFFRNYNGTIIGKVASTEAQGAYPIKGAAWTDVQGGNSAAVTSFNLADAVGNVTANTTMSLERTEGVREYSIDQTPSSALLKGYIDDSPDNGNPTTLTFSNIPYAQYRVIVYMSTDAANNTFAPVSIGGISYASAAGNTATATVMSTSNWGHTGPDHNANDLAEGVNYLVSPMMTSDSCVISTVRTNKGPRGTIAAVQFIDCTAANRTMTLPGQEITLDANTKISDIDLTATKVLITVKPGVTLTFDKAVTLDSLRVVAEGTAESPVKFDATVDAPFANIGSVSLEGTAVELVADIYVDTKPSKTALEVIAIASNAAATADTPQEITSAIAVASGKTLKTKGYLYFSNDANAVASGATLEVVSGVTTFNAALQGIKGTLTIDKGATFKNVRETDALAYNTSGVQVNVYGTLDLGSTRWTIFANNNTINAYAGATITGAGQSGNGALDVWEKTENAVAIKVLKNGNDATDVTISATIRYRDGKTNFNIAEGMTVVVSGSVINGGGRLNVTGDGIFEIAATSAIPANITNNGTITYTINATPTSTLSGAGVTGVDTATLNMLGATLTDYTGTFAVVNNGTLILPAGKEEGVTVAAGSTLKLNLTDDQLKAPYTTSATIDGGTLVYTKNVGADEVTEGVEGGAYTPATAAVYTVADATWSMDPFANAPVEIDFGETTKQSVNLAEILGEVTSIKSLTVKGTYGGALASTGVTIPWTDIKTVVTVDSYANQFGAITIYPNASLKLQPVVRGGNDNNWIYNVTGKMPEAGQARPKLIVKASADCGLVDNEATSISNVDFEVAEGSSLFYLRSQKIGAGVALIANGPVALEGTANTLNLVGLSGAGNFKASNSWNGHGFAVNVTLPEGAENAYSGVLSQHGSLAVSLTVSGAGKLTLAGANTYSGGTTINNGATLVAASATALGTGNVANSGTLELNATDVEATLAQVISGGGAINVKSGSWALTAANTGNKNVTIESGAMVDISSENARLGYEGQASGSVVTVKGTLKVRDWNWDTNNCLGKLDHNPNRLIIDGGKIIFTANITSQRKATLNGDVTFEINENVIYTAQEPYSGDGNLTIDGSGTLALTATDSLTANSSATVTINANATLQAAGTGTSFYRTVLGTGKIVIPENTALAIGEATNYTGETKSGLSNFAGTIEIAGTLDPRSWAANRGDYTIGACNIVMQGGEIKKLYGSEPAKVVIADGKTLSGTGTIYVPVTFNAGATLDGAVTVNADVTVAGAITITHADEAGDTVITCNNAADIVASLPTAPTGLKYAVDAATIKLAVAKVTVTIPTAPENTKWYDADGNVVEAGTIAVDPNANVTLTLKADEGYVFADGTTSKDYTVNSGGTGASFETPDVNAATPVAQVGETKYQTLQDAIDVAPAEATVTVIADIVTDGPITVNKKVTVNLGGKTITATNDTAGNGVFYVVAGGDLTLEGEGMVNALGPNAWCMAVWAKDGGKVTINGGTYTNVGATSEEDGAHFDLIYVRNGGSVEINGGTFICETPRWTLNSRNDEPGTFVVKGGTFKDFNPAAVNTDDNVTTWCAEGYEATEGEDGYWTVALIPVSNNVAKIGETEYATLDLAFEDVKDNETIVLLKDITANVVLPSGKTAILDLNGQTINGYITVTGNSNVTTKWLLQNGFITNESTSKSAIIINYAEVELTDITLVTYYHGLRPETEGKVVVNSGSYKIVYKGNGCKLFSIKPNGTAIINGGTFEREINLTSTAYLGAVYVYADGRAVINGGVFKACDNWKIFEVAKDGVCDVTGGKFDESELTNTGMQKPNITGGMFVADPLKSGVAAGYMVDTTVNPGYYTVVEKPAIQLTIDLGDGVSSVAYKIGETTTTIDKDTTIDIAESGTVVSFAVVADDGYFAPTVEAVTVTETTTVTIAGVAFSAVESADAAITDANRDVVYAWAKSKGKSQSEVSAANYLYADYLFNFAEFSAAEPTIEITEFTADPLVIKAKVTVGGETKIEDLSATGLKLNGTLKYKAAATLEALEVAEPKPALDATDRFFKVVVE